MFQTRKLNQSQGVVLLPVLASILVISLIVTGLLAAAKVMAQTENRRQQSAEAYWLAHGAAAYVLHDFLVGQPVSAKSTQRYPDGSVQKTVQYGDVWHVLVTARTNSAISVVRFDYDAATQRVLDWQEHVPAP